LIALDMDGTILAQNVIIPPAREALDHLVAKGIRVAIVTGRKLEDVQRILKVNDFLDHYPHAIASEGSFVHLLRDGYYLPDDEWNEKRKSDIEILRISIGDKSFEFADKVKEVVTPISELIDYGVIYFAFKTNEDAEKARLILDNLTISFKLAKIIRNQRFVGLTIATGLKGDSLLRIVEGYGLSKDEVLAIGDSHNDEDMLSQEKGFAVSTTSNADPTIKGLVLSRGGYVASRPIGEGVVEILSEYFKGFYGR